MVELGDIIPMRKSLDIFNMCACVKVMYNFVIKYVQSNI